MSLNSTSLFGTQCLFKQDDYDFIRVLISNLPTEIPKLLHQHHLSPVLPLVQFFHGSQCAENNHSNMLLEIQKCDVTNVTLLISPIWDTKPYLMNKSWHKTF